jgi:hypothetical protein
MSKELSKTMQYLENRIVSNWGNKRNQKIRVQEMGVRILNLI